MAPPQKIKSLIPAKYTNPETSGLTENVNAGMDSVTIELVD